MKRICKKFVKPVPEGFNNIPYGQSLRHSITFRTIIEGFLRSVLVVPALRDAILAIDGVAIRTVPPCRFGRVIIAKGFHIKAPFSFLV
jgi:hypothetical protein